METTVYVDVLLVLNYIINTFLLLGTAKLAGRSPKRRRIVAAALFGSLGSLTIFLPFMGFFVSIASKLFLSAAIVLLAFGFVHKAEFLKQWFLFFAVNFSFAGSMLGIWMLFAPHGMLYYNGIVYFHISSGVLIAATIAAYALLTLLARLQKHARIQQGLYTAEVHFQEKKIFLTGIVDTGNRLYEPFSNTPVMVCGIDAAAPLFPSSLAEEIKTGKVVTQSFSSFGIPVRFIPYQGVGANGVLPAVRLDFLTLSCSGEQKKVESAYLALSPQEIGGKDYNALLSPDFIGIQKRITR